MPILFSMVVTVSLGGPKLLCKCYFPTVVPMLFFMVLTLSLGGPKLLCKCYFLTVVLMLFSMVVTVSLGGPKLLCKCYFPAAVPMLFSDCCANVIFHGHDCKFGWAQTVVPMLFSMGVTVSLRGTKLLCKCYFPTTILLMHPATLKLPCKFHFLMLDVATVIYKWFLVICSYYSGRSWI